MKKETHTGTHTVAFIRQPPVLNVHLLVDLEVTFENNDLNVSGKRHILAHTQCLGTTVAFIWQPPVFNVHLLVVDLKFTYENDLNV